MIWKTNAVGYLTSGPYSISPFDGGYAVMCVDGSGFPRRIAQELTEQDAKDEAEEHAARATPKGPTT